MEGQLKQVIVALDNSRFALVAVEWGAHLAKASEANLVLIHVLENRYFANAYFAEFTSAIGVAPVEHAVDNYKVALGERGKNILAAGEQICRAIGVTPECKVTEGIFYEVVLQYSSNTNLFILGRRGDHSNFGFHLLGAEGERAIRYANCSCLVVPDTYYQPEKLVVGIHQSGPSRSAIEWAQYFHTIYPRIPLKLVHVSNSREKALSDHLKDTAIGQHQTEIIAGDPEKVLIDLCSENPEKTLCLIGATGHSRTLKELILGTVSSHLLHKLKGPVLLAR